MRITNVQEVHMGLTSNLAESFMNVRRVLDGNKSTDRGKSTAWSIRCYGKLNLCADTSEPNYHEQSMSVVIGLVEQLGEPQLSFVTH